MSKEAITIIKLQVPAGDAKPSSGIGPALGQHGLNIADFCKQFNSQTANEKPGRILPVIIKANKKDRSFVFEVKKPPMAELIKEAAGISKGSSKPKYEKVATITMEQVEEIAKTKMPDLNAVHIDAAMQIVMGSARSMGVEVSGKKA